MTTMSIVMLCIVALFLFGALGFFIYMNVSIRKMEKAEKEAANKNKNKK